ncbi:MAG: hypothetical protein COS99_01085 [Candidatus Omnitrophica bacterium CG07_land_8_20_14_0_80_42_15]|uniref:Sulfatase N-terminal domain-containing protein n=1 Tax=Candidatus Aquitaenariimonas noxiae TaxID=1974741 RepID=A0A2J0KUR2_9BACT|nr:MAG: hypothetical protein COS99_01085 [Candidatus Omnitrophica bacterium CG07_land_8_20_14_0_80_42_15]
MRFTKKYTFSALGIIPVISLINNSNFTHFFLSVIKKITSYQHSILIVILERYPLVNHPVFLFFLLFSVSVSIFLFTINKIFDVFVRSKTNLQKYFFLCCILLITSWISLTGIQILSTPVFLSELLIPLLCLLVFIAFYSVYFFMSKAGMAKKCTVLSLFSFIVFIVFFNLYEPLDVSSNIISKGNSLHFIFILIVLGLAIILIYSVLYIALFWFYTRRRIKFHLKLIALLSVVLITCIAIFGFDWAAKKSTTGYRKISSSVKNDVNILLIVIDCLRADHLGCYGYERQTSPNIDSIAKEGILFKNCYAQASWTRPSVASLLTSLYPGVHMAVYDNSILPDEVITLPEILKKEGYVTYGYVATPVLKKIFNFDQGFDFFDDYRMRDKIHHVILQNLSFMQKVTGKSFTWLDRKNAKADNDRIIGWLEKYKDQNFFMFIHCMEPHWPFSLPRPYRNLFSYDSNSDEEDYVALYDAEIHFADTYIGELLKKLKTLGIYNKTLIIITADHGQSLGEHNNWRHGQTIYQEVLSIPLIIKYGKAHPKGKVISQWVRSIDIMPTILDFLNVPCKSYLDGVSFLQLMENEIDTELFEYGFIDEDFDRSRFVLKGIIKNDGWKYIYTIKSECRDIKNSGREELYNLTSDPYELNNLVSAEPGILKFMQEKLDFYKNHCEKVRLNVFKETRGQALMQQLKALKYVQ